MNPHTKGNKQAPITLKNTSEERTIGRGGGRRKWVKEPCGENSTHH